MHESSSINNSFSSIGPDAAGIVSWIHVGDLHMTAGDRTQLELADIVDDVNRVFDATVSFVFLPGDVADDGSSRCHGATSSATTMFMKEVSPTSRKRCRNELITHSLSALCVLWR